MRKKTTAELICENFKVPHEMIFIDYKCTYKNNIPYFGRLYIGELSLLFVSNMFGIVKKCILKIDSITSL